MQIEKLRIMEVSRGEAEFGCFALADARVVLAEAKLAAGVRALCASWPVGEEAITEFGRAVLSRIRQADCGGK